LAPWYSHVERFVGISGNKDGLETLPDGEFLPPWEMNAAESKSEIASFPITKEGHLLLALCSPDGPKDIHFKQGRGKCQARNLCQRGCPFGGYFSSNASTLPWPKKPET